MKIAVRSYHPEIDHLNGFGGLEQRLAVNWAEFWRQEGHEVIVCDEHLGCDSSFDLWFDAPISKCDNIRAKKHIHNTYNVVSLDSKEIQNNPCYQTGNFYCSTPYRVDHRKNLQLEIMGYKHISIFMPLPYPDSLLPPIDKMGFERTGIMWANKGNFDPVFTKEHPGHHLVSNGIEMLKALLLLNKKADFKITFLLDSIIRKADPALGLESLLSGFRAIERFDRLPWTEMVSKMAHCKFNMHPGGITGGINEAVFVGTLPIAPANTVHMNVLSTSLNTHTSTAQELYEVFEELWFNERLYQQCLAEFLEVFEDHRTIGLRKHWARARQILEL